MNRRAFSTDMVTDSGPVTLNLKDFTTKVSWSMPYEVGQVEAFLARLDAARARAIMAEEERLILGEQCK